jgi:hypothetical protein
VGECFRNEFKKDNANKYTNSEREHNPVGCEANPVLSNEKDTDK